MALKGRQLKVPNGKGNRNQTLPWRDDIVIRERMDEVAKLWNEGLSVTASVAPLNSWLVSKGYQTVQRHVVTDDRKRLMELARELHPDAQFEHSEKMRHLANRLYARIDAGACDKCGRSGMAEMAEAQMYSVIQRTLAEHAKVDGAVIQRVETKHETVSAAEAIRVLVLNVLPRFVEHEKVLQILESDEAKELEKLLASAE